MKAAIYARVSTKDKGQEVENQLRQLREFAASQGWTIYREFMDRETGATDDRDEFQSMFRDASQHKFDVLLFWALDRLSREGVLETFQHLNRLTTYGVGYRSFTEQYFDSCGIFKDAVIAIIATVAKQERVRISQRVKAGLETASRAFQKRSGRRPFHNPSPSLRSRRLISDDLCAFQNWRGSFQQTDDFGKGGSGSLQRWELALSIALPSTVPKFGKSFLSARLKRRSLLTRSIKSIDFACSADPPASPNLRGPTEPASVPSPIKNPAIPYGR